MQRDKWIDLWSIYDLIEAHNDLDSEDLETVIKDVQTPNPQLKWGRSVRNVLQARKPRDIEWDGDGNYLLKSVLTDENYTASKPAPQDESDLKLFVGKTFRRRDLHKKYGGQQQGGIATPADEPVLMLFTGNAGMQHGYTDGWTDDDIFEYYGEGQIGDMEFIRGNRAIRGHVENGKSLLLFQSVRKAFVRFVGEMTYVGYRISQAPDTSGNQRNAIVFQLVPTGTLDESSEVGEDDSLPTDLDELRKLALADSADARTPKERRTKVRRRSVAVKEYARARSAGSCEGCTLHAPFITTADVTYLEVHHVHRLSDGGPDRPDAVVAICPNCHRRVHHGVDGKEYNLGLAKIAEDLESSNQ